MNIEDRLDNWARAVRFRCRRGHAMSFEGNYRSPQRNHWDAPVIPITRNIDSDDAWQVEAAWSTLALPHRIMLRCHYCMRWPPHRTCKFMGKAANMLIKLYQYEQHRLAAQDAITQALERSASQNRNIVRSAVKEALAIPEPVGYIAS